jgi:endonuclease/exonuclease/phosphatase family metal-dependent hydrolase
VRRGRRGIALEAALLALAAAALVWGHRGATPGAAAFAAGPRPEGTLRVVTWNVGGALQAGGAPLRDDWLEPIAAALRELDPDLVLLQEVARPEQLARLRRELGRGWRALLDEGSGRRVALLARDARLAPLPGAAPSAAQGRALAALVSRADGAELAVVVVHADAFSARARNALLGGAVETLRAATFPARRDSRRLRLLGGDLNLDLDLDKRRDLFSDDAHLDVESYNAVASALEDAARGRGATAEPDRRLDYLFVDSAFRILAAGPWPGRRVGSMDHDPVVADLAPP